MAGQANLWVDTNGGSCTQPARLTYGLCGRSDSWQPRRRQRHLPGLATRCSSRAAPIPRATSPATASGAQPPGPLHRSTCRAWTRTAIFGCKSTVTNDGQYGLRRRPASTSIVSYIGCCATTSGARPTPAGRSRYLGRARPPADPRRLPDLRPIQTTSARLHRTASTRSSVCTSELGQSHRPVQQPAGRTAANVELGDNCDPRREAGAQRSHRVSDLRRPAPTSGFLPQPVRELRHLRHLHASRSANTAPSIDQPRLLASGIAGGNNATRRQPSPARARPVATQVVSNNWFGDGTAESQRLDLSCPAPTDGGGNTFHSPGVQPPDPAARP